MRHVTRAPRAAHGLPSSHSPLPTGTYDKEIEALKEMVERTRAAAQECREAWEATVTKKNAVLAQTGEGKSDLETRRMKGASTARGVSNSAQMRTKLPVC